MEHELKGKNYKQALEIGYKKQYVSYQRGYVSVKTDINTQPVLLGGQKHNKPYVLAHCSKSTQYCYRIYLTNN